MTSNAIKEITSDVMLPLDDFRLGVKHLGLQDNGLEKWSDIDGINAWFPNLNSLQLIGNPLSNGTSTLSLTIQVFKCQPRLLCSKGQRSSDNWLLLDFQSLVILMAALCVLVIYICVEILVAVRSVCSTSTSHSNVFQVSRKERADCELYYLSSIARGEGSATEEERCRKHPRWKDLCSSKQQPCRDQYGFILYQR